MQHHDSPADCIIIELFKQSKDAEILLVCNEFFLSLVFHVVHIISGMSLGLFG